MLLTPHFSLEEFTMTAHRDIDNSLPNSLMQDAILTCQMFERIRTFLNVPMNLTSGYRCPQLNRVVGSQPTSDHPKAKAGDWTAELYGSPYTIAVALSSRVDQLGIGQLIYEFGRWVHTGRSVPDNPVNRIITIDAHGTRPGIVEIRP